MSSNKCFGTWGETPDDVLSLQLEGEWLAKDRRTIEGLCDKSEEALIEIYKCSESTSCVRTHILSMLNAPMKLIREELFSGKILEGKVACKHSGLTIDELEEALKINPCSEVKRYIKETFEKRING